MIKSGQIGKQFSIGNLKKNANLFFYSFNNMGWKLQKEMKTQKRYPCVSAGPHDQQTSQYNMYNKWESHKIAK